MSKQLPPSWGLKTRKRTDGKLDIVGKDDAGAEYRVRTTDGPEVTDNDISELHDADRETYAGMGREAAVKQYVNKIVDYGETRKRERDDAFGQSLIDPAANVTYALLDRKGHSSPFTGSTSAYRRGWEHWVSTLDRKDN